jgi:hypothetical protein
MWPRHFVNDFAASVDIFAFAFNSEILFSKSKGCNYGITPVGYGLPSVTVALVNSDQELSLPILYKLTESVSWLPVRVCRLDRERNRLSPRERADVGRKVGITFFAWAITGERECSEQLTFI